jgi:hypothetical protein
MSTHSKPVDDEVVHIAAHPDHGHQRCARCGYELARWGFYPPGQSIVTCGETTWKTNRPATCKTPPLRAHDVAQGVH